MAGRLPILRIERSNRRLLAAEDSAVTITKGRLASSWAWCATFHWRLA